MLGHDVLTTREAGNAGQAMPDHEVLDFATRSGRAVLTLNRRDFIRLHRSGISHAGIVVCSEDADTAAQAARVHDAVSSLPSLAGRLVRGQSSGDALTAALNGMVRWLTAALAAG